MNIKLMMIMTYDNNGVIATNSMPEGSTVTPKNYEKFLQNVLCTKIYQRMPGILAADVWR